MLVNSAVSMTLPAFAAERRRLLSIGLSPASGALSSTHTASRSCCRTMGHTDGRTLDRCIDLASCNACYEGMRVVSIVRRRNDG